MKLLLLIAAVCLCPVLLRAQATDVAPPLPPGPLLAETDFAHWIVTTTPGNNTASGNGAPAPANAPAEPPTIIEITRTGDTLHMVTTDARGKSDRWCVGKIQFIQEPGWDVPIWLDHDNAHGSARYISFGKALFPELSWISASNYTGIKLMGGRKCLVFTGKVMTLPPAGIDQLKQAAVAAGKPFDVKAYEADAVAYIDAETRFPVSYVKPYETSTYQILPAPTAKLTLPDKLQKMNAQINKRQKELQYKPAQA